MKENDLVPLFQRYGAIVDIRIQPERGFAFIKYVFAKVIFVFNYNHLLLLL